MKNHISAGHSIRALRIARNWSQEDLAERANTTKATVSKIERTTMKVSEDWLERFAKALEVTRGELLGEVSDRNEYSITSVPVIGKIAAGNWREAVADPVGHVLVIHAGHDAFALTPDGDSMNLVIPEGATVIIEPQDTKLRDGKIYAIMNGEGEATLKMFRAEPARLEPRSTNAEHQPIFLGQEPFTVIGRVTQITQTV